MSLPILRYLLPGWLIETFNRFLRTDGENSVNMTGEKYSEPVKVNLGCGRDIRPGYVNVDLSRNPGIDFACDANDPLPLKDSCIGEILCVDFVEHIKQENMIHLMNELWRILQPGASLIIHVPEAPGVTAFQDPTHISYWNEETFTYFLEDHRRREEYGVHYGVKARFERVSLTRETNQGDKYDQLGLPDYLLDVELVAVKD